MKTLAYVICYLIYPFSFLIPRSKKCLAFGSYRGSFSDNSKYLFLYAEEVAVASLNMLAASFTGEVIDVKRKR